MSTFLEDLDQLSNLHLQIAKSSRCNRKYLNRDYRNLLAKRASLLIHLAKSYLQARQALPKELESTPLPDAVKELAFVYSKIPY